MSVFLVYYSKISIKSFVLKYFYELIVTTTSSSSTSSVAKDAPEDIWNVKKRRVDKKFEKLSSQTGDIDENAETFDERFDSMVHDDELSNLQGDFSKMSWDDSVSPTTTTQADIGQNTPDNDIQDLTAGIYLQIENLS